jgi:hypothetical protein
VTRRRALALALLVAAWCAGFALLERDVDLDA